MNNNDLIALRSTSPELAESVVGYTIADFNHLLTVITTRPGLRMEVHEPYYWCEATRRSNIDYLPGLCIDYNINLPNTYRPDETLNAHMHQSIPRFVETVEDFYDYCLAIALWFENHEGREWFKLNGRPYRDPHGNPHQLFYPDREFAAVKALRPQHGPSWAAKMQAQMGSYAGGGGDGYAATASFNNGGSGYGFAGGG